MSERIGDRQRRHQPIVCAPPGGSGAGLLRRVRCAAAIGAAVLALAGCGGSNEKLPAACTGGPAAIAKALGAAPGAVRVAGVPISHCFNRGASADDVQIVGANLIAVADQLGDQARSTPNGGAALRLGYLVGAARRGSARNGLGIEIVRRLEEDTGDLQARSGAYSRGLRAGLAKG
jgi:hypothetical protein